MTIRLTRFIRADNQKYPGAEERVRAYEVAVRLYYQTHPGKEADEYFRSAATWRPQPQAKARPQPQDEPDEPLTDEWQSQDKDEE